jgi:YesN/AraC family two-component response regulator
LDKVLIVDDERMGLEYVRDLIPWGENEFKIVGEAVNGKLGLELYQTHYFIVIYELLY